MNMKNCISAAIVTNGAVITLIANAVPIDTEAIVLLMTLARSILQLTPIRLALHLTPISSKAAPA